MRWLSWRLGRGGGPVVTVLSLYWDLVGSSVVLRGRRPGRSRRSRGSHSVAVVILRSGVVVLD